MSTFEFKLPDVGEGIHEAEVVRWLVKEGDPVTQDQPILEIQTDKALVEIPSPVAGTVAEIRAKPGQTAHLGDVIIVLRTEPAVPGARPDGDTPATQQNGNRSRSKTGVAGPGRRVLAAPAVRKVAREMNIDLNQVPGSAPGGRVLLSDLKKFAAQQKAAPVEPTPTIAPPPDPTPSSVPKAMPSQPAVITAGQEVVDLEPLQGLQRRIAERMDEAWRVPHVTSFAEVEVGRLTKLRQSLKPLAAEKGVTLTYLPFVIKAAVQALKEFPRFNASLDMDKQTVLLRRYYHLGIATAIPEGLVVPVLRHADQLNMLQIGQALTRLADLARERRLGPSELSGSTFTITNFGSFGGQQGTPIINPPEVAILGLGRIAEKPVAVKGKLKIRPVLPLALSFDHRLLDGAAAAQFLGRIEGLLSNPKQLMLEL